MCFIGCAKKHPKPKKSSHSFTCTVYVYDRYLGGNGFLESGLYFVSTDTLYTLYVADTV